MADWVTISSFATAGGTLILAAATFASVRSANRAAGAAERRLLVGLRPVLVQSRLQDPDQKISWVDEHWTHVGGSGAGVELIDDVIYLSMSLRNLGAGLAVLHGWHVGPDWPDAASPPPEPEEFRRQTRDLYVPPDDLAFWQGAIRGRDDDAFAALEAAITSRRRFTLDVLYGDHEGGQRAISRFGVTPRGDAGDWLCSVVRHWNLDRPDPR